MFLPSVEFSRVSIGRCLACAALALSGALPSAQARPREPGRPQTSVPASAQSQGKPNILVIFGDDVGVTNLSCYSGGLMGYETPNIDRIAAKGCVSFITTASSRARRDARLSSPDSTGSARGSRRSASPARPWG